MVNLTIVSGIMASHISVIEIIVSQIIVSGIMASPIMTLRQAALRGMSFRHFMTDDGDKNGGSLLEWKPDPFDKSKALVGVPSVR